MNHESRFHFKGYGDTIFKTITGKLTMKRITGTIVVFATMTIVPLASAGVLDPDCTAEKAAKSAAAKATVGVGGRCSPAEAAKDTAKRVTGIEKPKLEGNKSADRTKDAVNKVMK